MTTNVIEVTSGEELASLVENNEKVIVDFAAPSWCVPCQRLAPHYEAAAAQLDDVAFVHVDIEKAPGLATQFQIMSVPTVLAIKNGEQVGAVTARTAVALIREVNAL